METRQEISYDILTRYGSKWAILTAMKMDLEKQDLRMPHNVNAELEVARIKITSGCYSTCEIDCTLSTIEGQMISVGSTLGEAYLDPWIDLMAQSMKGELGYEQIIAIPALKPVQTACGFLKCGC